MIYPSVTISSSSSFSTPTLSSSSPFSSSNNERLKALIGILSAVCSGMLAGIFIAILSVTLIIFSQLADIVSFLAGL